MSPSFVLDTSITMAWCFADEATPETAALNRRLAAEAAVVPGHWPLEVSNVLSVAERKKRISLQETEEFVGQLGLLEIQVDHEGCADAFKRLIPLTRSHALTAYDAAYLELALRRRLPLATLDRDLRKAAKAAGVETIGT